MGVCTKIRVNIVMMVLFEKPRAIPTGYLWGRYMSSSGRPKADIVMLIDDFLNLERVSQMRESQTII